MEIKIREATKADVLALHDLSQQLGYVYAPEKIRERLEYAAKHTKDRIFIAEADEKIAGYIHLSPYYLIFEDPMINVLALVVDEKLRGQGIGKRLLRVAEEYSWNGRFSAVRLNSSSYRTGAHKFYEANGYEGKDQKRFLKLWIGFNET